MSSNIYVGNLSYEINNESLQELFEEFGEVVSAKVISDRETGRSRGFGFVEMSSNTDADTAIQNLNGKEIKGRSLKVNVAKPKKY
jgi:RNA recognition motif-containing protein